VIVSDAVNNLALTMGASVDSADELISAIVVKRLVEHLERSGFVVMKRPPIGGGVSRAYDSGAFDPTGWGEFRPCEDEAVDGGNLTVNCFAGGDIDHAFAHWFRSRGRWFWSFTHFASGPPASPQP
jgi:hypothetical protein